MKLYAYSTIIAVALLVTFGAVKDAQGKLVFEDEIKTAKKPTTIATVETESEPDLNNRLDRESDSNVASDVSSAADEPVVQDVQSVEVEPSLIKGLSPEPQKRVSKSESLRRHRVREELKNEDLLQQKLEELRLRDELKRTDQINLSGVEKEAPKAAVKEEALPEQRVGSAATEVAPIVAPSGNGAVAPTGASSDVSAQLDGKSSTDLSAIKQEEPSWINRVTLNPRAGLSSVTNSNYDIQSRYAVGLAVSVDFTDHFAFEGSYTYSRYDIGAGGTLYNPYYYSLQKLQLSDNVFDVGGKAYILDTKSRLRPFVGVGLSYRRGYVNYDDRTLTTLRSSGMSTADVQISSFSGYIETGMDLQITKAIAFTAAFKYFNTFSSSQSNPINPNAFVNPYSDYYGGYSPYGYGVGYSDARAAAGEGLAQNNFYQILGGIAVSF